VDGAWVVQQDGDVYTFSTSGQGYAFVPSGVGWDGDYAFKTRYALDTGTLGFSFDATQSGRYYVSVDARSISLVKEDASDNRTVLTQAQAPAAGEDHYLAIAKKDGVIQVYVDKVLWLAYEDDAPLPSGTIMVGALDSTSALVDDVLVNKIAIDLPQKAPAVAAADPADIQDVAPPEEEDGLGELPDPGDDLPDPPPENDPVDIPLPTVTFTGHPEAGGEPATTLSVPPFTKVVLEWWVENSQAVYIDGEARGPVEDIVVSTGGSERYELEVVGLDGVTTLYYVQVNVVPLVHGPDFTITASVYQAEGTNVGVEITITNQGDQRAENVMVRWYAHERDGLISLQDAYALDPGAQRTILWPYDYGQYGNMHWSATVDEHGNAGDVDLSDNQVRGAVDLPSP
jgi:hypothetical protein